MQTGHPFKPINVAQNAFSRCAPFRVSGFQLFTKRIDIQSGNGFWVKKVTRIRKRGMDCSAESIRSCVYSFKKIARLHLPRCPLRGASKTSNKPQRRDYVLTFLGKDVACKTYALRQGFLGLSEAPRRRHRERCKWEIFLKL